MLAPVAVLTLGVVALTVRRQRLVAAAWVFALALFGCFWFLRNLAVADSPLPWFDVELGPIRLRASALQGRGDTFVDYLFDSTVWRDRYLPGFRQALSATWPLVLLVGIGGAAVALVRRGDPLVRLAGAMVLTGAVSYAFTPLTADAGGLAFVFNLRYLTPTLLLGFALVPLWLPAGARWGRGAAVVLLAQVAVNASLHHYERVDAWPAEGLVWGVLAGAGVLGAVAWHRAGSPRARLVRPVAVGLAAVLVLAGGAAVQRRYLEHRYVDAGLPLDAIDVAFRDVSDRRVAIAGSLNIYPLFGVDLSNEVERVDVLPGPSGQERCRRWKEEVNRGSFDYLVAGAESFFAGTGAPPETWVDAAVATEVASGGGGVAYRLSGPLDPDSCPPDTATPTPPAPAPGG